jgi:DNA-binding transcriptional LysR family regulator
MAGIHRAPTPIAHADGHLALPALDLNLLKVFAAVHHFCQVTAAARQLDMTPSAVSNALTRLRGHCGDALFVRTQRGVVPTPYANRLALAVSNGLNAFALGLQPDAPFTPASSERTFRVNVADVGQMLMIGSVMRSMGDGAPGIGIHTVDLPVLGVEAALMRGDLEFAVGHLSSMGKTLFRRKLVTEHFVCVVGAHNKRLRKRLTVEDFLDATHIRYSPAAASLARVNVEMDRFFRLQGRRQRVALEAAHAFGLSSIVAESEHVLTVPGRLAAHYARLAPLVIHPLPIRFPPFDVSLYWHERDHRDPAHQWFRERFAQVVQEDRQP